MHALGLCIALVVFQAAPDSRGEHLITYARSGGWRGMKQSLEVKSLRTATVSDEGITKASHALKPAEATRLKSLLRAARSSRLLEDKTKGKLPDGFEVTLTFDSDPKPTLLRDALTFPPTGAGPAWDELVKYLDSLLEKELKPPVPAPVKGKAKKS